MKFIIATHNAKKLAELSRILLPLGVDAVTDEQIGLRLDEVEETGVTFEENARIKARAACEQTGFPAVADDSGLEVDALGGAPGVYSARYGAPEAVTDSDRNALLLHNMAAATSRTARFVSVVCAVFPDGSEIMARGECEGVIGTEPSGDGGFGYDPLFLLADGTSFAEISPARKDEVSHRGAALRKFVPMLEDALASLEHES